MRVEKDGIGELEISENSYYGIQTYRGFKNFKISGTQVHPVFIKNYLLLKKAAGLANKKLDELSDDKANAIINAVDKLLESDFLQYFIIDAYQAGAGTSQNMNANEVIANVANELLGGKLGEYKFINPNDHVNMSQSTNDTYPTVMQLSCLVLSYELVMELELISQEFENKSIEFDSVFKSGRTHLQDAVPIRLGQEFKAIQVILIQLTSVVNEAQKYLRQLGIGGSAVGNGINVHPEFSKTIIKELQNIFDDKKLSLSMNKCTSMQFQLPMILYSNSLRVIALQFTKILNDLRLMSSGPLNGFGEISLPEIQPGSSIMPGKINPSILEMGNQVCFKVLGNDSALGFAIQAGQLELNVMMPLMAQLNLESTQLLINAIASIRTLCITGIKANREHCRKQAEQTSQMATLLSPIIGYGESAKLVKESIKLNKTIIELVKEKNILPDSKIKEIFDLDKMTN